MMGWQVKLPMACVLWFMIFLTGVPGLKGNDISPSPMMPLVISPTGHLVASPTYHEIPPRVKTHSHSTLVKGVAPSPSELPPESEAVSPMNKVKSPAIPPTFSPSHEWSHSGSPSVESQAPNLPAGTDDVLPPSSSVSPPSLLPKPRAGVDHATAPSTNAADASPPSSSILPPAPLPKPKTGKGNATTPTTNTADVPPPSSSIPSPAPLPKFRREVDNTTAPSISPADVPPLSNSIPPPASVPKPRKGVDTATAPNTNLADVPPSSSSIHPPAPLPKSGKEVGNATAPSTDNPVAAPHAPGFSSPPTMFNSPAIHGKSNGIPASAPIEEMPTHLSHVRHSHFRVSSPNSSEAMDPPDTAPAPLISYPKPEKQRTQTPALAPTDTLHQHGGKGDARSPMIPPSDSSLPSRHQGPSISPLLAPPLATFPKNQRKHHVPSPVQGPSISPSPLISVRETPAHSPLPPGPQLNRRPIQSPAPSLDGPTMPLAPSSHRPVHAPAPFPSGYVVPAESGDSGPSYAPVPTIPLPPPHAPRPLHARAFPPPSPNSDCIALTCKDPLTYTPPGSPCGCVLPMKVGLRLSVVLYTFFPLVSELAQEIAFGTFLKQSQVRIMGANAADEQPEKTIVLVDLVPLREYFDNTTAFLTFEKFWHKDVGINTLYFGDYDVLYVTYPGLPPSPPVSPSNINVNDGPFGNDNNSRTIHPLGVDVRKRKEKLDGSMIAIIVISSVIALALCAVAAWLFLLKRSGHARSPEQARAMFPPFPKASVPGPTIVGSRASSTTGSFSSSMAAYTGSAKAFSAAEMEGATDKFKESNIIGEGGFGRVYQGTLEDGTRVAVKVLKRDDQQGSREFLAEVEMLSRLHHRHLVKLIGICTEEHLRCLVYELIPNGSVESHLHGVDKERSPLDWFARMKIALGSARGLAYLHEDSSPRVIHRDFKSSNILLENDFTPKVSDFGLARTALEEGNEHISTRVMGTFGYVAPEYAMTGHLLVKSDVYSYGVVLLELLTGRKPVDMTQPPGQENLVTWALPLLTSKEGLEMLVDSALGSSFPFDSVAKVAAIASMCVQPEASNRPFMGEVAQALKLVCNENDEHRPSGSCNQEDLPVQDLEIRISTGMVPEIESVLSASDIFSTSGVFTREASGSFRRYSSSGPLRTSRGGSFWQKVRGLSRGSMSEHGPRRYRTQLDDTGRWP